MRISLCTTCFNRAGQLKHVFESNLDVLRGEESVEWLILNYNSQDDLDEFMLPILQYKEFNIRYFKEISGRSWHMSLAKNISHKLASGDILMNLDCDNRIGEALDQIREAFTVNVGGLHLWSGRYGDGTCGRKANIRELFFNIGGYDESFRPMAYQDEDLLARLRDMGETVLHVPEPDAPLRSQMRAWATPSPRRNLPDGSGITDITLEYRVVIEPRAGWWQMRANCGESVVSRPCRERLLAWSTT